MKEVRNELLKELREKVEIGRNTIKEALEGQSTDSVRVGEVFVERRKLESFYEILEKMSGTSDVEELKALLYEGVVPPELVVISRFWGRLQTIIEDSYQELKMSN